MQWLIPQALLTFRPKQEGSHFACYTIYASYILFIRNEIRLESLFLQAKILLAPNHHEGA
jgi:hypothetical protein